MKKGTLTLYTVIGHPDRLVTALQACFKEMTQSIASESNRITLTLLDDTSLVFTLHHQQDNPDFIASHTAGMAGFFAQVETTEETLKENVLRQIRVFNSVTGISFDLNDDADRTNYIVNRLCKMAGDVHGFLLYPDMQIYTGKGLLLFSAKGETELREFVPIANADLLDAGRPEETDDDKQRCQRSIALLKEKGIPFMARLRNEVTEAEATLKSRKEMVQRAVALFAVAVYSEVMLSETPDREAALAYVDKMDELYEAKTFLTSAERAYIDTPEPEQQLCIQFVWRYECCGVLLWAAGIIDELSYPSQIIDVPVLAAIFWQHNGVSQLLSKGFARSTSEILDAADLTHRYDWATVDARIHGREAPAGLDGGIVVERHYAFNWIIGANEGADWDDIQPNT